MTCFRTRKGASNLFGGAGNDRLSSGANDVALTGGAGNDVFFLGIRGQQTATIADFTIGEDVIDLSVSQIFNFADLQELLVQSGEDTVLTLELADFQEVFRLENIDLTDLSADDFIFGDPNAPVAPLTLANGLSASQRLLIGGDGDETLTGSSLSDRLFAEGGNDIINAGSGADVIFAGDGDDIIDGGNGQDLINGGDGADIITDGSGADVLTGGGGADIFVLAPLISAPTDLDNQIDRITDFDATEDRVDLGNSNIGDLETVQYFLSSRFGSTTLNLASPSRTSFRFRDGITFDRVSLTELSADNFIFNTLTNDLVIDFTDVDNLVGGAGNDNLQGNDGEGILAGLSGDDILNGGLGEDRAVFTGDRANYTVALNEDGSATVSDNVGSGGVDTLSEIEFIEFSDATFEVTSFGLTSNLSVNDDNFIGTSDADIVNGAEGNDTLNGQGGAEFPSPSVIWKPTDPEFVTVSLPSSP